MDIERTMYDSISSLKAGDLVKFTRKAWPCDVDGSPENIVCEMGETARLIALTDWEDDDDNLGAIITLDGVNNYIIKRSALVRTH